jgi:hypothetical protein
MRKIYFLVGMLFIAVLSSAQVANTFFAPQNLTGAIENDTLIHVTWDEPGNGAQWIHWDSSEYFTSVGLINGGTFYAASRWTAEELEGFENYYLSKIAFFPTNDTNATYTLQIWQGEGASNLILSQDVESVSLNEWNEVLINEAVQINTGEELWFGFSVTQQAGFGVAGVDEGPALQGKGDYISTDGTTWNELPNIGYNYNWNLKAFLSFSPDGKSFVSPQKKENTPENVDFVDSHLFMVEKATVKEASFMSSNAAKSVFQYYRLIHKIDGGAWEFLDNVSNTSYDYFIAEQGIHYFMVYAIYQEGESLPEGPYVVNTSGDGIEEISNSFSSIYPNPTSDIVHLTSQKPLEKLLIYNTLGVLVRESNLTGFEQQINVSDMAKGTYIVKIYAGDGVNIQRLMISK